MANYKDFPPEVWYRIFDMLVYAWPFLPLLVTHALAIPNCYNDRTMAYETQVTIPGSRSNFLNYCSMGINCEIDDHQLYPLTRVPFLAAMITRYRAKYLDARQEELASGETFHLKFGNVAEMSRFFSMLTPLGKKRVSHVSVRWNQAPTWQEADPGRVQDLLSWRSEGTALHAFMVLEECFPNLKTLEITLDLKALRRFRADGKPREAEIENERVVGMSALKRLVKEIRVRREGHAEILSADNESAEDLFDD